MNILASWNKFFPRWQLYFFLAAAILIAYANAWPGAFVYDDTYQIAHNAWLRDWSHLPQLLAQLSYSGAGQPAGFHRPLVMLVYFLLWQIFGGWTPAYHGVNIALHIANASLMVKLGEWLNVPKAAAVAAALLWAVHPLQVEAVTYISGLTDPLFVVFALIALLAILSDTKKSRGIAILCHILALCSKEAAVTLPALATIALLWRGERRQPFLDLWPLWLLSALYAALYLTFSHVQLYDPANVGYTAQYAHHIGVRILTALATLPAYVRLLVWPAVLHEDRTFPIYDSLSATPVLLGLALALAPLVILAVWRGRRGLALACGMLWFGVALSPCTGIAKATDELICEHWMYLPTLGLFLGIASTLAPLLRTKPAQMAAAALIAVAAVALGTRTYLQNRVWQNSPALYAAIFASGDPAGHAHNDLGIYYMEQAEFDKAIPQFQAAIANPAPMPVGIMPDLHINLAKAWLGVHTNESDVLTPEGFVDAVRSSPHLDEAIAELNAALAIDPGSYWANQFLAVIYSQRGEQAKADFYNAEARAALSNAKQAQGQ